MTGRVRNNRCGPTGLCIFSYFCVSCLSFVYTIITMTSHTLQLATEPFAAIEAGQKTIESRLYDEKRQQIQRGDQLVFVNREDPAQTLRAEVIDLHCFDTFRELFEHTDIAKFAKSSIGSAEAQIRQFYSPEDEATNGVLGIEFKLVQ